MFRKQYLLTGLFCTIFIYASVGLFSVIPSNFDFLNPISDAIADVEITDIVFSKMRRPTTEDGVGISSEPLVGADTSIILVNIGNAPLEVIGKQMEVIAKGKPKVIGVDAMFFNPVRNKYQDSCLAASLRIAKTKTPIVLVSRINFDPNTNKVVKIDEPLPYFKESVSTAYANLISEGVSQFRTSRDVVPKEQFGDSTIYSFPVYISKIVDSSKFAAFIARNNTTEIINYRHTQKEYMNLDVEDVFDPFLDSSIFKDKIVMMGYLGPTIAQGEDNDWIDKFYTPMNDKYAGRSSPDMYGLVVHANTICMILNEDLLDTIPDSINISVSLVLCLLNVILFAYINDQLSNWYDLITKAIQIGQLLFILYLTVYFLYKYSMRIDLTVALVGIGLSGDLLELYLNLTENLTPWFKKIYLILQPSRKV